MQQVGLNGLVQTTFDYSVFDEDTRIFVKTAIADVHVRFKRTAEDIIGIGEQLLAVKEKIEHGLFLQLLKAEFDMSQRNAYRFMAVAEKNRDNPEFATVANSKDIGPGRVLYALAEASDDTIAKVSSGEIPATAEAIQERKRAERAEEKARKAEEARIEAERKAEDAQMQLSLFQSHSQLAQGRIDEQGKEIELKDHEIDALQKQIDVLQEPKPQEIRYVLPEEAQKIVEKAESDTRKAVEVGQKAQEAAAQLRKYNHDIAESNRRLSEEARLNGAERLASLDQLRIRQSWRKTSDMLHIDIDRFMRDIPNPIDREAFESDDWSRYAQCIYVLEHAANSLKRKMEENKGERFVDGSVIDIG